MGSFCTWITPLLVPGMFTILNCWFQYAIVELSVEFLYSLISCLHGRFGYYLFIGIFFKLMFVYARLSMRLMESKLEGQTLLVHWENFLIMVFNNFGLYLHAFL